jgi:hypothetical protein
VHVVQTRSTVADGVLLWYVAAPHVVHVAQLAAPAALHVPAAQAVQVAELVAPVAALFVPATHCVQLPAPAALQVPAPQVAHVAELVAPVAALAVPALQLVQLATFVVVLYVPEPHAVQPRFTDADGVVLTYDPAALVDHAVQLAAFVVEL